MSAIILPNKRILINGLGLMGGSLALALRNKCREVMGIDTDPMIIELAQRMKVADRVSTELLELMPLADMLILATPIASILKTIKDLPNIVQHPIVVMDLGSTKEQICQAYSELPMYFDVIGGHPMCGKEKLGLVNAEAELFNGAFFALTPLSRTSPNAIKMAKEIIEVVSSRPIILDPITHDKWVAMTSHLPFLISSAIVKATEKKLAPMIGPGYRSVTRLAATPSSIMLDVIKTNHSNILQSMDIFKQKFQELEYIIKIQDEKAMINFFKETVDLYTSLTIKQGEIK